MIFISHSSKDSGLADRLLTWLRSKDFSDVFLDIDRFTGLLPGDPWPDKLREAHKKSTAYLFAVTRNWLESSWCRAEYQAAHLAGKRVIPLLCDRIERRELPSEMSSIQLCDLHSDWDAGLSRLESALILATRENQTYKAPDSSDGTGSPPNTATGKVTGKTSAALPLELSLEIK